MMYDVSFNPSRHTGEKPDGPNAIIIHVLLQKVKISAF